MFKVLCNRCDRLISERNGFAVVEIQSLRGLDEASNPLAAPHRFMKAIFCRSCADGLATWVAMPPPAGSAPTDPGNPTPEPPASPVVWPTGADCGTSAAAPELGPGFVAAITPEALAITT